MRRPEFAARRVLQDLNIKDPADLQHLEEIAYTRGALVQYARLIVAEARISIIGEKAIITVSDAVLNRHRLHSQLGYQSPNEFELMPVVA